MGKYIRVFIAIIVMLVLVVLARNKAAWAANPAAGPNQPSLEQAELSVSPDQDADCDKDKDEKKDKDKCKDKDDDDDDGDDHNDAEDDDGEEDDEDDDNGSVQPPDDDIEVCKRGTYSVGGEVTLEVKKLRNRDCLTAHLEDPDSLSPPPNSTIVSNILVLQLPAGGAKIKICFAVPPGKQVKISSFVDGSWRSVSTRVKKGIACAEVSRSGAYTLVTK